MDVGQRRRRGDTATRAEEIATLRLGLDSGATLIDTAEMYGDGRSEELIADAIAGRREDVFLVSKVYPHNASARGAAAACERSLRIGVELRRSPLIDSRHRSPRPCAMRHA